MFRTLVATIQHIRFELSNKRPYLVFYVTSADNYSEFLRFDFTHPRTKQLMLALLEYSGVDDISKLENKKIRALLKDGKVYALGHLFEDKFFTVEQENDELIIKTFAEIANEDH